MSNKRKLKNPTESDPVRAKIAALVAGGVVEDLLPLDLPVLGVTIHLRRLQRTETLKMGAYAVGGDEDDIEGKGIVGIVRWMVCDDRGRTYLESYEAAAAFLSALDDADFAALMAKLEELNPTSDDDDDDEGDGDDVDVVEAGKGR